MTTFANENTKDGINPPPVWLPVLKTLLENYQPTNATDPSAVFLSSQAIIQSIEEFFNIPQGSIDFVLVDGISFVEEMQKMGYKYVSVENLRIEWVLSHKKS